MLVYHYLIPNWKQYGETPLHTAAKNGRIDITEFLLEECNAELGAKDKVRSGNS